MKKKIVVIDSGLGGLFVLKELEKVIVGYEFIYIADTLNAPYGTKNRVCLKKIAEEIVFNAIRDYSPEMIVVACNTLTVNAIKFLRKRFTKTTFVGVEPAIKQAKIYGGNTIVLSTPATQKNFQVLERKINNKLKKEYRKEGLYYKNDEKIFWIKDNLLASKIETDFENLESLTPYLKCKLEKFNSIKIENFVLGCTHYIAIKENIKNLFRDACIFDGALAVATRAKSLLKVEENQSTNNSEIKFVSTDKSKEYEKKLKKYYILIKRTSKNKNC